MIIIWLDDLRDPQHINWAEYISKHIEVKPEDEIIWLKSYDEFITWFISYVKRGYFNMQLKAIFFDNDLGPGKEGYQAFNWYESFAIDYQLKCVELFCQSSNPSAKQKILLGFDNLNQILKRI